MKYIRLGISVLIQITILLLSISLLLSETVFSKALDRFFNVFCSLVNITAPDSCVLMCGYAILVCSLIQCAFDLITGRRKHSKFYVAFSVYAVLFVIDFTISSKPPQLWPFYILPVFFLLYSTARLNQIERVFKAVLLLCAIQCFYAVYFYFSSTHQFITPNFGNRSGGTFQDPNKLYPLCLLVAPIYFSLGISQRSIYKKIFHLSAFVLVVLGLALTFTRAGWLSLACALIYLIISPHSPLKYHRHWRNATIMFVIIVIIGSCFVRTKGAFIGNRSDRSFWGRTHIWTAAGRVILKHPWMGSGVGGYAYEQRSVIDAELSKFNPTNKEGKSLYLNTLAEQGVLGFFLLVLLLIQYFSLCNNILRSRELMLNDNMSIVTGCIAGAIGVLSAGLVDTPILQEFRLQPTFVFVVILAFIAVLSKDQSTQLNETHAY